MNWLVSAVRGLAEEFEKHAEPLALDEEVAYSSEAVRRSRGV